MLIFHFLNIQGCFMSILKLEGLVLPIMQTLFVFQLFSILLHLKYTKTHFNDICNIYMVICVLLVIFVGLNNVKYMCDEAKNDPFLGGHLSRNLNLFDQIMP